MPDPIYHPQDRIADRYTVQQLLGAGSFAYVYKVLDEHLSDVFALKLLRESTDALHDMQNEFAMLRDVNHPHIARVFDAGVLADHSALYIKLEYVQGSTLSELVRARRISLAVARQIIMDLLDAVEYLHARNILHRDLKPSNVITDGRGAVIVDFSIAKKVELNTASQSGTLPYMPPEVYSPMGWTRAGDLFCLGELLYEMLTGRLPYPNPPWAQRAAAPNPAEFDPRISSSLVQCILKAIELAPEARYQSAAELRSALEVADWEPVSLPITTSGVDLTLIPLSAEEARKPNYNPYVTRLLTLYSQSRRTNAGTRGLDAFANATYVPTRLDRSLEPAILSGAYSLVIITGNAGDGKTAFIQKVEARVKSDAIDHFQELPTKNGARFEYNGNTFLTNYDGSQDEGTVNNDQVLAQFFEPFRGHGPFQLRGRTHIIAINEGRLIDFLQQEQDDFPYLYEQIRNFFEAENVDEPRLLMINLNLRAVVADEENAVALFDQMLDRFAAPALWEKCSQCDIAARCYAKFNADSLNDPNYGSQIRARLKALFQIAHLRRRLHITIRDLRSALAYMLAGTSDCDEIHTLLADPAQRSEYLARFYYNALFGDGTTARITQDRLIRLLVEVDPGRVSNPRLDAVLTFGAQQELKLLPPFDARSAFDLELVQEQRKGRESAAQRLLTVETGNQDQQMFAENFAREFQQPPHIMLRRKVFFERVDNEWRNMLPYTRYEEFLELVTKKDVTKLEEARDALVYAISLSEGIFGNMGREYLCLRTAQDPRVTIKSFRRFRRDRFRCRVMTAGAQSKYIEYLPAMLLLEYRQEENANIRLEIGLDLYEMLHHIRQGYTPSLNELRGSFVSLLIFKRQLASTRYDEVLLTQDEEQYYRVYQTDDKKLVLTQVS